MQHAWTASWLSPLVRVCFGARSGKPRLLATGWKLDSDWQKNVLLVLRRLPDLHEASLVVVRKLYSPHRRSCAPNSCFGGAKNNNLRSKTQCLLGCHWLAVWTDSLRMDHSFLLWIRPRAIGRWPKPGRQKKSRKWIVLFQLDRLDRFQLNHKQDRCRQVLHLDAH